jgi:hypothetical protein
MPKLLALISNPDNTYKLRGDREVKEVINCIRSKVLIGFTYEVANQIKSDELIKLLNSHRPELIHFTGHGNENAKLLFENVEGETTPISNDAIEIIFKRFGGSIKCAFFSACYSSSQAKIISKYVSYAIGFPQLIEEEIALYFARNFYETLANGLQVEEAFILSLSLIKPLINDNERLPVLYKKRNAKEKVLFKSPKLVARFKNDSNLVNLSRRKSFEFILSVDHVPSGVTAITYEIIENDFPDDEKCTQVFDLDSGNSAVIKSYGDLIIHVWFWSESQELGFGIKCTLLDALKNYYGEIPNKNINNAIARMKFNDENNN